MKNKRLLILMSVFVFIVAIVVLCSSFFSVKNIVLAWQSDLKVLTDISEADIIKSINVSDSDNIFLVNRDKCIEKIEKQFPYVKVESIEKSFPNKLVLKLSERQEMYIIKIQDGLYAYLDDTGRVLRVDNSSPIASTIYPCMLYFEGITIMHENFIEGRDADLPLLNMLVDISNILRDKGCSVKDSYNLLKQITIRIGYNTHVDIVTNHGLKLVLRKVDKDLAEKLDYGLNLYQEYRAQSRVGEIAVFRDGNDSISSTFTSL